MFEIVNGHTHTHTDTRTPARVLSYKLTLWAFGSGRLKKPLCSLILYIFFMILSLYITPGRGWQPFGDIILMPTGTSCHFGHLLHVPKNLFEVWFYRNFFMILYMYIAPRQGQAAPKEQNFDVNRKVLSLHSFVASFKKTSLKSDFIQFFSWFNDVNRKDFTD